MVRSSGRRLWRCRGFAILILALTFLALLITWKQLPDEGNFNNGVQSAGKQWLSAAAGSTYFDIRQPVEKVSVRQVTLVHAERSYPKENKTALDNSSNASSSLPPASPALSESISPDVPQAASSPPLSSLSNGSVLPSSDPLASISAEQRLAKRKALIETSKKVRKTILA